MQKAIQPFRGLFFISFDLKIETSVWSTVTDKEESEGWKHSRTECSYSHPERLDTHRLFFKRQIPQVTISEILAEKRNTTHSTFRQAKAIRTTEYQTISCAHIPNFIFSFPYLFLDPVFSAADSVYSLWLSRNETEVESLYYSVSTLERYEQSWLSDFLLFHFIFIFIFSPGECYFLDVRVVSNDRSADDW